MILYPSPGLRSHVGTARKFGGGALCRMCGRAKSVRPLTRHHLVPQRWFRGEPEHIQLLRSATANLIPLCRPCHDEVDNRDRHDRMDARRMLRRSLTQAEVAFAIQVWGRADFDREYPAS